MLEDQSAMTPGEGDDAETSPRVGRHESQETPQPLDNFGLRGMQQFVRPAYRRRPLPVGQLRGRFVVAPGVVAETRRDLVSFALAGIDDGGHEGMVFWAGHRDDGWTCFMQAIVPDAEHGPGHVSASRAAVGAAARAARSRQLGILAQVHSHPGDDARHSDGDDDLVLMPFEGMLSVVAPRFGLGFTGIEQVCVHQFQDGRWMLCTSASVSGGIVTLEPHLDLRAVRGAYVE
jgi:hypothetical protein